MSKALAFLAHGIAALRAQRWVGRGERHLAAGTTRQAHACCVKALSICNNLSTAHALLARVLMPGNDYLTVLTGLHERLKPASYLEIGVRAGASLALALPETRAVGVDPRPVIDRRITARARLYPIPSDEFFNRYQPLEELGVPRLAMSFIDGLHHFEQVLKDFINVERWSDAETVIVLHDCLPVTRCAADRIPRLQMWCGDVWKMIPCLKKHRPDLTIRIIPTRPSGLAIVTGANPRSTLLRERFDAIIAEYQDLDLSYEHLDADTVQAMPGVVPNIPERIFDAVCRLPSG